MQIFTLILPQCQSFLHTVGMCRRCRYESEGATTNKNSFDFDNSRFMRTHQFAGRCKLHTNQCIFIITILYLKKTTDIYLLSLNTKRMMYLFLYVYIYVYSNVQDKIILARGY